MAGSSDKIYFIGSRGSYKTYVTNFRIDRNDCIYVAGTDSLKGLDKGIRIRAGGHLSEEHHRIVRELRTAGFTVEVLDL